MNSLKQKIKAGQTVFGTHVSLSDPQITDILGRIGFDYIWIDMEHTALSVAEVYNHIAHCRLHGTPAIVRNPPDDYTNLKHLLEMGPDGIVFPMVRDAAHAKQLIDYTLYPPIGVRGFGPRSAIGYGLLDTNEYLTKGCLEMCRFIQIETATAYEDLDAILANPYVDGVVVGPCDFAGAYGLLTDVTNPESLARIRDICARAKAAGKAAGFSIGDWETDKLRAWIDLGVNMISAGSDTTAIVLHGQNTLANLQEAAR